MNLYETYTDKERKAIFDEANITIENRDYSEEERLRIANVLTEGIMSRSSKNNEINDSFIVFNPIIDKLRIEKR